MENESGLVQAFEKYQLGTIGLTLIHSTSSGTKPLMRVGLKLSEADFCASHSFSITNTMLGIIMSNGALDRTSKVADQ